MVKILIVNAWVNLASYKPLWDILTYLTRNNILENYINNVTNKKLASTKHKNLSNWNSWRIVNYKANQTNKPNLMQFIINMQIAADH